MEQFIKIPRAFVALKGAEKVTDIIVYACIAKYNCEGTARIAYETLNKKYNICSDTITKALQRLESYGALEIDKVYREGDYPFNEYHIPQLDNGYLKLDPSLLDRADLKPRERGFLILYQLVAMPNMNQIPANSVKELAKLMNLTERTTYNYLNKLKEDITVSKAGYYMCKYLSQPTKDEEVNNNIKFAM